VPSAQAGPQPTDRAGKPVKDSSDFFAAGGSGEELRQLGKAAPQWTPSRDGAEPAVVRTFASGEIRGEIHRLWNSEELLPKERGREIARRVVLALTARGALYFHAEARDFDTAMFRDRERKRLERVRSDSFLAWLSEWTGVNGAATLFRSICAEIETAALSPIVSKPIIPEVFWASRPGAIYLSCGDEHVVKVTAEGCAWVDNSRHRFSSHWTPPNQASATAIRSLLEITVTLPSESG
jgi:hypothetical protein